MLYLFSGAARRVVNASETEIFRLMRDENFMNVLFFSYPSVYSNQCIVLLLREQEKVLHCLERFYFWFVDKKNIVFLNERYMCNYCCINDRDQETITTDADI